MDIENGSRGARWVCPNDRHLALRAKLRTGWSVKTMTWESRWNSYPGASCYSSGNSRCSEQSFVLTEEERRRIIQVIQRAEALDLSEQERVGRLVERLENMKRNVCIATSNRANERRTCGSRCSGGTRCVCACALCAEKFGAVLGASPNLCKDCRKYVCQKCGIEASSIIGGSDGSAISSGDGSSTISSKTSMRRLVQRSTGPQKQFLCRICAETREMWKKSGAWFFKGMPKYVLPEKKERGWCRTPHRTSPWTVSPCKSLEHQESSSDEDVTKRLAGVTRGHSTSTSSLHSNRDSNQQSALSNASKQQQQPTIYRERSSGDSATGLPPSITGQQRDENEVNVLAERLERSNLLSIPSPSNSVPTSTRVRSSGSMHEQQQRVSFEDDVDVTAAVNGDEGNKEAKGSQVQSVRRESPTTSVERTPPSPSDRLAGTVQWKMCMEQDVTALTNGTRTASLAVESPRMLLPSSPTPLLEIGKTIGEKDYGTVEVCLRYDPAAQCLQCKVERARGLRPMDIHGLADPFCKLNILPVGSSSTTKRLRTKTVHKTCDPEFNEILNFYGTTEKDMNSKALHILVLQDDPSGQDFLGEARFPLYELQPCQTKRYNAPLRDHYPVESEEETWGTCTSGRGRILLTLSYCTRRRALLVTIHRAINLLPMDSNGFSDPFVKVCLTEWDARDNHRQSRGLEGAISRVAGRRFIGKRTAATRNVHNTTVKWKTLNPEWNEEFAFGTRLTDLTKLTLCVSLWDKDFGKTNDYLGGLTLSCSSKGARLRHWVDAIKFPDHRHQAWHDLTEAIISLE